MRHDVPKVDRKAHRAGRLGGFEHRPFDREKPMFEDEMRRPVGAARRSCRIWLRFVSESCNRHQTAIKAVNLSGNLQYAACALLNRSVRGDNGAYSIRAKSWQEKRHVAAKRNSSRSARRARFAFCKNYALPCGGRSTRTPGSSVARPRRGPRPVDGKGQCAWRRCRGRAGRLQLCDTKCQVQTDRANSNEIARIAAPLAPHACSATTVASARRKGP